MYSITSSSWYPNQKKTYNKPWSYVKCKLFWKGNIFSLVSHLHLTENKFITWFVDEHEDREEEQMRGLATVESKGDALLKAVMIQKVDTGVTKAQLFLLNSYQLFQLLDHNVAYFF